jgi:hypothetical protein
VPSLTELDKLEEKVDKIDDMLRLLSDTQSRQTVLLQGVLNAMEEEAKNSTRISILEVNWLWLRGIIIFMLVPITSLVADRLI